MSSPMAGPSGMSGAGGARSPNNKLSDNEAADISLLSEDLLDVAMDYQRNSKWTEEEMEMVEFIQREFQNFGINVPCISIKSHDDEEEGVSRPCRPPNPMLQKKRWISYLDNLSPKKRSRQTNKSPSKTSPDCKRIKVTPFGDNNSSLSKEDAFKDAFKNYVSENKMISRYDVGKENKNALSLDPDSFALHLPKNTQDTDPGLQQTQNQLKALSELQNRVQSRIPISETVFQTRIKPVRKKIFNLNLRSSANSPSSSNNNNTKLTKPPSPPLTPPPSRSSIVPDIVDMTEASTSAQAIDSDDTPELICEKVRNDDDVEWTPTSEFTASKTKGKTSKLSKPKNKRVIQYSVILPKKYDEDEFEPKRKRPLYYNEDQGSVSQMEEENRDPFAFNGFGDDTLSPVNKREQVEVSLFLREIIIEINYFI